MNTLLSLLLSIQDYSQQLLNCLNLEKHALDNEQLEKLNTLATKKQQLIDLLQDLDQQRAKVCGNENFNQYVSNSDDAPLITQWELTRSAIADCQKQNEINGRLILKRSQTNLDILTILTGRNQQQDETYNARGNQTKSATLLNNIKA